MKELVYYTLLYDIYGNLLTDKQKSYFEEYYFKNLSLSELGKKYGISRNAVHKQLNQSLHRFVQIQENLLTNSLSPNQIDAAHKRSNPPFFQYHLLQMEPRRQTFFHTLNPQ